MVPRCMNQLASLRLLICDYHSEKKQEKIWLSKWIKDLPNPVFFWQKCLIHIISTFSTCPAVLQISRTSECLMTYSKGTKSIKVQKKVEFCLSLLLLLKLYFLSLPQQSGKPFCCCAMLRAEVNSWWQTTRELGN